MSPSSLSDFETRARHLRYEALGNACVEDNITELLLAHHSDDQAETVLMRLAAGAAGNGLQAMSAYRPLPECWGMHGVHESGLYENSAKSLRRLLHNDSQYENLMEKAHLRSLLARPAVFESGGINALRPLLDFSKEQLREICEANHVEWEEDESNHDISITPRNTIRSLLKNDRLPQALQKHSLLRIAEETRLKTKDALRAAHRILDQCKIISCDIRSSIIVIRLPKQHLILPGRTDSFKHSVCTYCLRSIAQIVCPQEDPDLTSMAAAARIVFSDPVEIDQPTISNPADPIMFTSCGVQFERLSLQELKPERPRKRTGSKGNQLDPNFVWKLSRQPFYERPVPILVPAVSRKEGYPDLQRPELSSSPSDLHQRWSAWHLWDGRFWIRIQNKSSKTLVLRAWGSHELQAIRNSFPRPTFDDLHNTLKIAAQGKIRWTLPVVAEAAVHDTDIEPANTDRSTNMTVGKDSTNPGTVARNAAPSRPGKILVFPTLGKVGWLNVLDDKGNRKLEWEVRYKYVQLRRIDIESVRAWDDGGQGSVRYSDDLRMQG